MSRSASAPVRAVSCLALFLASACQHSPPQQLPPAPPTGVRLVVSPEGALLGASGQTATFTVSAFDANNARVDASHLDIEWVTSNAAQVTIAGNGTTAQVQAATGSGSAVISAHLRSDTTNLSNPAQVLVGTLQPGVQLIADPAVVFPPPGDPALLVDASGRLPDISAPDSDGHVTIGGFADTDVVALYTTDRSGDVISIRKPLVVRGTPPAVGAIVFGSQGAKVAGKVVSVRPQGNFSLIELEQIGVPDVFDTIDYSFDQEPLVANHIVRKQVRMTTRQLPENVLTFPPPDCTGDPSPFNPPTGMVQATATLEAVAAFEYRASKTEVEHILFKAGVKASVGLDFKLTLQADVKIGFECLLPPDFQTPPIAPPGPMAALFAFSVDIQPKLSAQVKVTAGLGGTTKPVVKVDWPFVFGGSYDGGVATPIAEYTPTFTADLGGIDGEVFTLDPTDYVDWKVTADAGLGITTTLGALLGGIVTQTIRDLTSWIPWIGSQVASITNVFYAKIVTVDTLLDLSGEWISMGEAIADKSDDGELALKGKIEGKFLPDIIKGLNKLLGAHAPLQFQADIKGDIDFWDRGSLKMHSSSDGTDTKIKAGTDQNSLAENTPVLVKDGDTVYFQVTVANNEDAPTGGQVVRHDSATPEKLVDLTPSGSTLTGSWKVPDGFCGDKGDTSITAPVIGFNKAFDVFPMSAYLGSVDITCSPLFFTANGTPLKDGTPFMLTQEACPAVDLEVKASGKIPDGATAILTSHIDLGDKSQDLGKNSDTPPDLEKHQGLKAGTYKWTGHLEITNADGSKLPPIDKTQQIIIGACDVIVCHVQGNRVKDGGGAGVDPGDCPPVDVPVDCKMPYAVKEMDPSFTSSMNGPLTVTAGPPPSMTDSQSLAAGTYTFANRLTVDAFGGGTENIKVNATVNVPDKTCPGKKQARKFGPEPGASNSTYLGYVGLCSGCTGPTPGGGGNGGDAWGDPHITTRAGSAWTSLELGEFIYAEPHPAAGVTGGMTVQVRQQKLPGFQEWASFDTAVAVSVAGHVFEVRLPRDPKNPGTIDLSQRFPLELLLDGQVVHLNPQMYVMDNSLSFRVAATNGLEIFYQDPTLATQPANPIDAVTKVLIGTRAEQNLLRTGGDPDEPVVALDVVMETVGPYRGILGRPDLSDPAQDFTDKNGTVHTSADPAFMSSWKLTTPSQSLFTYQNGEGPETFDVPQANTQPSGSQLDPFIAQVSSILTDQCGLTADQASNVDSDFVAEIALELAAGRSAHNLVESGLCQDPSVAPPSETALVAFNLTGTATLASRPDIPVAAALVTIVAREPGKLLCQTTTQSDGRYGCSLTDFPDGYAGFDTIHLDYTFSGRGPIQTATETISPPVPDGPATSVNHDFSAQVQNVLLISGTVLDPRSVPLGGALLRLNAPELYETRTDPTGAYTMVLALPDGVTHGVLQLDAFAADSSSTASASHPFTLDGPGIHSVALDVQMQATPGTLPPFATLRRVLVTGTVTDELAAQQDGSVVPLGNLRVNVSSAAFGAGSTCGSVFTAADGSYQCIAIVGDGNPFTVTVGTQLPGQTATLNVTADAVPQLGQMTTLTQDLSVSPATLLLSGTVDTAQGAIARAAVDVTASSGETAHAVTGADGAYSVYLPLKAPGAQSPLLTYAFSLGGSAVTVQQAVNAPPGVLTPVHQNARFVTGTAVLGGRVVDALADNAPVSGAQVAAIDSLGHVVCQAITSATGVYGCAVATSGTTTAVYDLQVSGRGSATFPDAVSVNQSQISAGQVAPVPVADLAVNATTVQVSGVVRDSTGAAVPGVTVGASAAGADATSIVTGGDGSFLIDLAIDEGRTAGSVSLSASFAAPTGALIAGAQLNWTGTAHSLISLTHDLTLDGNAQAGTSLARIAFSGTVTNTNAPGTVVPGARVQIAFAPSQPLCDVFTAADGTYACHAVVPISPVSPANVIFSGTLGGGVIISPLTVSETFVRGGAIETRIVQDLTAFPSTLSVHGTVADSNGFPVGGAVVTLQGDLSGTSQTDEQGAYSIVAVAPFALHEAKATVSAHINGLSSVSQAIDVTMVPNGIAGQQVDLTLVQRSIGFTGTVENALAAGTFLSNAQITLSNGGSIFCTAQLRPAGNGTPPAFTCPRDLPVSAPDGFSIDVFVQNAFGSAHSTVAVTPPDPGQRGVQQLQLSLAATAVTVSGTVHGVDGGPLPAVAVSLDAAGAIAQATTDSNGQYTAMLTLPDALPQQGNGLVAQIAAIAQDPLSDTATASVAAIVTGGVLAGNSAVLDLDFHAATNFSFSGTLTNANASVPAIFDRIAIFQDGLDPAVGLLCTAFSDSRGNYACDASVLGRTLASIDLRYEISDGSGQHAIADPLVVRGVGLTGTAQINSIPRALSATPTTVIARGHLLGETGAPIAGATMTFANEAGSTSTAFDGSYALAVQVTEGSTSFSDTLTASSASHVTTTAPAVLASLIQRGANPIAIDLAMSQRLFGVHGRVQNTSDPDGSMNGSTVTFRIGSTTVCSATVSATTGSANDNYVCLPDFSRSDGSAFTLAWSVDGPFGSTSGTTDIPAAQVPAAGGRADEKIVISLPATTLDVTGVVTVNGKAPGAPVTVTGRTDSQTATVQSDPSGHYELFLTMPAAATDYALTVVASDGKNSATATASGAIPGPASVVPVAVSLDISTVGGGTARFAEAVQAGFFLPDRFAPALDSNGVLYEFANASLQARSIGATGTSQLWSGGTRFPFSSPLVVEGPAGGIYYGDDIAGVHKLSSGGIEQWKVGPSNVNAQVLFVATNGTLVFALQDDGFDHSTGTETPPRVRAFTSDGTEQWDTDLSGTVAGLAVSPDGTVIAATSTGLWGLRAGDGRVRYMVPGPTSAPAFPDDGTTVVATSTGVSKFDVNGVILWGAQISNFNLSTAAPPVVDQDGSVLVASGTSVTRISGSGDVLATVDGGLHAGESFARSGLVVGGDGTVYVGSSSTGGTAALYAYDQTLAQRFRFQPAQTTSQVYQPVLASGSVYFIGANSGLNPFLYAVTTGTSAGLSSSSWPQMLGDNDNHARAAPSRSPLREIVLQGTITNANNGGRTPFPLPGAQVFIFATLDGAAHPAVFRPATADANGAYFFSLLIPQTTPLDAGIDFHSFGVEQNVDVTFAAGAPGSSTALSLDQQLAVTTLELVGAVHIPASPGAPAEVFVDDSAGDWIDAPAVSTVAGAYHTFLLYDAATTEDTLSVHAEAGVLGVQNQVVDVQLNPGALTVLPLDFTLTNRPATQTPVPGLDLTRNDVPLPPAASPASDAVYFTVQVQPQVGISRPGGARARLAVRPHAGRSGSTIVSSIAADGVTTLQTLLGGSLPTPTIGGDGNLYVAGPTLIALDPALHTLATYNPLGDDPAYQGGGLSAPAIVPISNGAIAISAAIRGNANASAVLEVQLDFTTHAGTRMWELFSPDDAPWDFPADQTQPVFGASSVYVPIGSQLLGIDPSAGNLLFTYQSEADPPDSPAMAGVWTAAGAENVQFLVPDGVLDSVTSAGTEVANWPSGIVPGFASGLAVGPTGISYFADEVGTVWAINPDTSCRWKFSGDSIAGVPALGSDGTLYVTGQHTLYALGDSTAGCGAPANLAWRFDTGRNITLVPGAAIAARKIWVIGDDGNAYGVTR